MTALPKNNVLAARLTRAPWWRSALARFSTTRPAPQPPLKDYKEQLKQLALLNPVDEPIEHDTVSAADLQNWLATLEGKTQSPGNSSEP